MIFLHLQPWAKWHFHSSLCTLSSWLNIVTIIKFDYICFSARYVPTFFFQLQYPTSRRLMNFLLMNFRLVCLLLARENAIFISAQLCLLKLEALLCSSTYFVCNWQTQLPERDIRYVPLRLIMDEVIEQSISIVAHPRTAYHVSKRFIPIHAFCF